MVKCMCTVLMVLAYSGMVPIFFSYCLPMLFPSEVAGTGSLSYIDGVWRAGGILFFVIDVTVFLTCDFLGFLPLNTLSFSSFLILATDDELRITIRNIWQKIVFLLYSTVNLHSEMLFSSKCITIFVFF